MIYQMVSSKSIIAKVIADMELKEKDIRITDMKEWIGEAMEKIGASTQYDKRIEVIPIHNYQAKLPCNLHMLNQAAFSFSGKGGWLPMLKGSGSFDVFTHKKCCNQCSSDDCNKLIQDTTLVPVVKNLFNFINDKDALDKINEDPNIRHTLGMLINEYTWCNNKHNLSYAIKYDIKPGYIYTNIPEGYVKLSYKAIHTDNDGMPMIPDIASYSEAIYWYIVMKLSFPKYYNGSITQHVYYDIKNSWNYYRKQAYAEALMPNDDEVQGIANTWHKIVPEVSDHATFFETTGDRQFIYNQN